MPKPEQHLVAIDIGSSKIGVLIGVRHDDGTVEVVGRGTASNRGARKGQTANVEATVEALKTASGEAEVMAGLEISSAYVGIAGVDLRSVNSNGMVTVARTDREITPEDVDRVLEAAQAAALPSDREILHAIPREFFVDDQGGILDPSGMLGRRLEAAVHLVTANVTRTKTLLTCVNRAGIEVLEMVFEPLAAADAVLGHDERELGTLLVDIGCDTTEYILFAEGGVQASAVLPVGAGHFTNDLSLVLRTPFAEAEAIKLRHGCCLEVMVPDDEGITVPAVAGGPPKVVPKRQICEILQPRAEELLSMVREHLVREVGDDALRGGVVLTGGGSQLDGLLEMAEEVFSTTVRYGLPTGLTGLVDVIKSPTWCTASGLLLYGAKADEERRRARQRRGFSMRGVFGGLRSMFSDLV